MIRAKEETPATRALRQIQNPISFSQSTHCESKQRRRFPNPRLPEHDHLEHDARQTLVNLVVSHPTTTPKIANRPSALVSRIYKLFQHNRREEKRERRRERRREGVRKRDVEQRKMPLSGVADEQNERAFQKQFLIATARWKKHDKEVRRCGCGCGRDENLEEDLDAFVCREDSIAT